jgi:hypothetical protein
MNEFWQWASENNYPNPVPEDQFHYLIGKWAVENKKLADKSLGFVNGKLIFYRLSFGIPGFKTTKRDEA